MIEVNLLILALIVVIVFYIGKRIGSSKNSETKKTTEDYEFYNDEDEIDADKDSWEGGFWDASDPKKLTAQLKIKYIDANKSVTNRSIRVRQFDNGLYNGIIMAHCELRNATRTFRFDRIKKCIDLETGEIITNVKNFLNELYEKSPERSTEILTTDFIDVLKVIYFVAKADGQYRKEEKEVISSYISKLVRDDRITVKMIDEALKEIDIPSMQAFKLALGRVLKGGDVDPMLLSACCQDIVDTQKSVHPVEKEALEYIDKKLSALTNT